MTPARGGTALRILAKRCGILSVVELRDGRRLQVRDIAWGRDLGDEFDHITTNCSPPGELDIEFFYTSDIASIEDDATGQILFEETAPDV